LSVLTVSSDLALLINVNIPYQSSIYEQIGDSNIIDNYVKSNINC